MSFKVLQSNTNTYLVTFSALSVSCIIPLLIPTFASANDMSPRADSRNIDKLLVAVESGHIAYKLTDANALKSLLGTPDKEEIKDGGGMIGLDITYPGIIALFGKSKKEDKGAPFRLLGLSVHGKEVDIGGKLKGQRQVIVRSIHDLKRIGLENVDLRSLDLSSEKEYLGQVSFDSLTRWPDSEKLPPGFSPQKLIEDGKDPGLGIRALHKKGINGEGVGIAILDQPLLLGHEEYSHRLIRYDATRATWLLAQFHGSPIVSIAVGKKCGVAPGAFVFYYAAPKTTQHWIQADYINEILKYNENAKASEKVRVISISASPESASDNASFRRAYKRALDAGILVVTCSDDFLPYGTLKRIEGKDPNNPESYEQGRYAGTDSVLLIPNDNKTMASYQGTSVYTYKRQGGMSWAAPYIAGLAALAFQVNPDLEPRTIVAQLVQTATHTKAGPIVNPCGFIESVKSIR